MCGSELYPKGMMRPYSFVPLEHFGLIPYLFLKAFIYTAGHLTNTMTAKTACRKLPIKDLFHKSLGQDSEGGDLQLYQARVVAGRNG